ncbi:MAG: ribosome recycling factor [Myxococcales bacterium]|nr:MAG: ribosome recycling factor [Myxococcales bacterium]
MLDEIYFEMEEAVEKALASFRKDIARVRTGRASPSLLDGVRVNYYNVPTPLNQVATISVPDARLIIIQPWEKSIITDVEKAIASADLGLNPISDGNVIRLPIPTLNEERRRDLARQVKKLTEETKVAVRNIRRDFNEKVKKLEKNKEVTEDEMRRGLDRVQKITDESIAKADEILAHKEKEIMEV